MKTSVSVALLIVACMLTGCSTTSSDEPSAAEREAIRQSQNVFPQNYKADIIAFMRNYLNDPTGVRSAGVSLPQVKNLPTGARYASCLRYDARNSSGRYVGVKTAMAVFISGRLDRFADTPLNRQPVQGAEPRETAQAAEVREACKDAAYAPFPELEKMTR
ncbi:MAG: hypothetical protein KIT85_19830 [Pseudolabrys sp.]|nr:hypothetical protein [Pseudolabrys sp.]